MSGLEPPPAALRELIVDRLADTVAVRQRMLSDAALVSDIVAAGDALIGAARRRSTVFFFGNGGSSMDAGHLAAELLGRFYRDRPPLPAIALADATAAMTAIGNDYGYDQVFERQLRGLGRAGDVAVGISTSGQSPNVIAALEAARALSMTSIALTGGDGGKVADIADLVIRVPSADTPRVQECHLLIGHLWCEMVERVVFGDDDVTG